MKLYVKWIVVMLLTGAVWAQTAPVHKKPLHKGKPAAKPAVTAEDIRSLRDALAQQQQQIQQLQQTMQQRDQALQQTQTQLQQAQSDAADARTRLAAVETTAKQTQGSYGALESNVNDLKQNLTSTVVETQEQQKRLSTLQTAFGKFRFTGDVRVRQEDFFQNHDGCGPACNPRIRERIRVRFGVQGNLNDDFQAGMFVASGTVFDPTSTNETLTNFFERKTIAWDRGYITYAPKAHKWLELTGGKFAFTWARTNQTFDPDINPEGFSEKLSFDVKGTSPLKSVTLTGMQLLLNEVAAPTSSSSACITNFEFCANAANTRGADSYAVGGQIATKLKFGRVTITPSYSVLNFRNEDAILNAPAAVTGSTGITVAQGPPVVASLTSSAFAPNGLTNATAKIGTTSNGTAILGFRSRFLYGDAILDSTIDTGHERFPLRLLLEYENNMRAALISSLLGRQSHLYKAEGSLGQQKKQGDFQFGYGFWRVEQDAVLSAFAESDQRAPTNIVQHNVNGQYLVRDNVTLAATLWVGRTLNSNLVNARLTPGILPGQQEPYLKRMQFDIIYKF